MNNTDFHENPHLFWQQAEPAGTFDLHPAAGHEVFFPVKLGDDRELALPLRELADGKSALASLIVNQASFEVSDLLAELLAKKAKAYSPDVVIGMPTLGLTLAALTAQKLGHRRYLPLGTSRKFWYREELSVPMRSVTSPEQEKRLYIDPRMLPLLQGKRAMLVDDVISSGTSLIAALRLLKLAGVEPVTIGAAMLQTERWRTGLEAELPGL